MEEQRGYVVQQTGTVGRGRSPEVSAWQVEGVSPDQGRAEVESARRGFFMTKFLEPPGMFGHIWRRLRYQESPGLT